MRQQRVVITAAGAGIGRAIAEGFAATGANVEVCDVDETAITDLPGEINGTAVDVTDEQALETWFAQATARMGGIDTLVNNAGIAGPTAPVEEVSKMNVPQDNIYKWDGKKAHWL